MNLTYINQKIDFLIKLLKKTSSQNRYCFVTSIFGKDFNVIDKPNKFKRKPNIDYYLFTNLDKNSKNWNTSWDIIQVPLDHEAIKDVSSWVIKSRLPKFMLWKYIRELTGKSYRYIVYCDGMQCPKDDSDFESYIKKIQTNDFKFLFNHHKMTLSQEMRTIVSLRKDTREKINRTEQYFKDNGIDPSQHKCKIVHNGNFIYDCMDPNVQEYLQRFWDIYSDEKLGLTHRDQPHMQFWLLKTGNKPLIEKIGHIFKGNGKVGYSGHKYC